MTAAWDAYHRRARAVRNVVDALESSGGLELPTGGVGDVFPTLDDLLVALHDLWFRRMAARVDLALELDALPPEQSVTAAWRKLAAELPAVRRLLDRHAAEPALRASGQHEHRMLALAVGRASLSDPLPSRRRAAGPSSPRSAAPRTRRRRSGRGPAPGITVPAEGRKLGPYDPSKVTAGSQPDW